MCIDHVSIGRRARLRFAFLAAALSAGLFGCTDPGIVTALVKLQQTPADNSEVLATIPKGSSVSVGNCSNGWCRISWNDREGYALSKYVRTGDPLRRTTDSDTSDGDDNQDNGDVPVTD
jgi:uncharacterized protein YraI